MFRILALGDSFTWGDKIARTEDTWPAELERLLRESYPGTRFEVVNVADRGYTTANEAELMRRLGWQFEPDVLLVQFFVNDIYRSGPGFRRLDAGEVFRRYRVLPQRLRGGAVGRSSVLALLEGEVQRALGDHDRAPLYEDDTVGWRQLQAALEELGSEATTRGVPAILLMVPELPAGAFTAESHPNRALHAKVEAAARQSGLMALDLTTAFADSASTGHEWWATLYDNHPGEDAAELIAQEAFRFLVAHDEVP